MFKVCFIKRIKGLCSFV